VAVVELIAKRDFGKMVCLGGERVEAVQIADAVGMMKAVNPEGELVSAHGASHRDLFWGLKNPS
jgi:hypothetical protein